MKPSDFFNDEQDPAWAVNGDPWSLRSVFDLDHVERLRQAPEPDTPDLDAAAHEELHTYGTGGGERVNGEEMAVLLRT